MQGRLLLIALGLCLPAELLVAQTTQGSGAQSAASTGVAAPSSNMGTSAPPGYILSPNDQVAVEVFGEEDLRTGGRLNPEGNLSVPLLGSIHLGGLTLTQAASKLTELYGRDYLVNPRVRSEER